MRLALRQLRSEFNRPPTAASRRQCARQKVSAHDCTTMSQISLHSIIIALRADEVGAQGHCYGLAH